MTSDAATSDPPILGIARKWWVVATVTPSLTLMGLNATILEIPSLIIIPELDTDRYRYQWATGAVVLGSVLGMAMLKWLRDRFGLKNVYLSGMFIFALASLPCGLPQTMPEFALARFFQGIGQGIVVTNVLATLWREFPRNKDLAMAFYGFGIYFGKAIAPTLGGFLCDYPDWRWIFYVNALAGAVTFILSWWILLPDKPADAVPGPFDFPGLWLLVIWVIALLVCLFRGQKWGWTTSPAWVSAAAAFIVSFTVWFLWEINVKDPLIDLRLILTRIFVLTMAIKSIYMIGFAAMFELLTDYMMSTRGYPRTTTGLVFLPGGLAMGATLLLSAVVGMDWSRKRRVVGGLVLMVVGAYALSNINLYSDKYRIAMVLMIWGAGAGLCLPPVLVLATEGLTQPQVVSSATLKNMVRVLPEVFGAQIITTIVTRRSDTNFDYLRQDIMPNQPVAEQVKANLEVYLTTKGSAGPAPSEQAAHVLGKYIHADASAFASQEALLYLSLLMATALVLALFLHSPHDEGPAPPS